MLSSSTSKVVVGVVDTGYSNISAVLNMVRRLGYISKRVMSSQDLESISVLILPGVGSFDPAVRRLHEMELFHAIRDYSFSGRRMIGICLGMQLLFTGSAEGSEDGLGLIDAKLKPFDTAEALKKTNMGWRDVHISSVFLADSLPTLLKDECRFYFAHSFYADIKDVQSQVVMSSSNGVGFACGVRVRNTFGFQFHPEKSHRFGMELLSYLISEVAI